MPKRKLSSLQQLTQSLENLKIQDQKGDSLEKKKIKVKQQQQQQQKNKKEDETLSEMRRERYSKIHPEKIMQEIQKRRRIQKAALQRNK